MNELPLSIVEALDRTLSSSQLNIVRVTDPLNQDMRSGSSLLPPEGAAAWMSHYAIVLCVPAPETIEWRERATLGARWLGDVVDTWWEAGRILDAYLVVVFAQEPSEITVVSAIQPWMDSSHICRRQAVWPDNSGRWDRILSTLTFAPLPSEGLPQVTTTPNLELSKEGQKVLDANDREAGGWPIARSVDLVMKLADSEMEATHVAD